MKLLLGISLSFFSSILLADTALDAYRMGKFKEAGKLLSQEKTLDIYGNYYLAEMRLYGYGLKKNNHLALKSYEDAAKMGYLPAQQTLARYYLFIAKNPEQAFYWFKQAALQKDRAAMMYCAAAYQYGYGAPLSYDISRKYYIDAAKDGDASAQFYLASYFLDDKKGADKKLAALWLEKALKQDNPDAQVFKAKSWYQQKEKAKAQDVLAPALQKNYPQALTLKAQWLLEENNQAQAHSFLLKAAKQGFPLAQYELGRFYLQKDSPLYQAEYGVLWLLEAAKNQMPEAKAYLMTLSLPPDQKKRLEVLNNPSTQLQAKYRLVSMNLTNMQSQSLLYSVYRIKGIWMDWRNQDALKEAHFNAYPKFFQLTTQELFKPHFNPILPSQISLYEYMDALTKLKGPVKAYEGNYPSYVLDLPKQFSAEDIKTLKRQAHLGVTQAQFQLAACYEFSWGVEKNLAKARKWYFSAMQQDDLRAQYQLAIMQITRGNSHEMAQGKQYLRDAAFKGDIYSQITLGLLNEVPESKNLKEAKNMFMLAAANGNGLGMYRLAEWVSREPCEQMSFAQREAHYALLRKLYRGAFKAGIQEAALPLAFYEGSSPRSKNKAWAMKTALSYASRGHAEAAILLGLMIDRDEENIHHQHQAKKWFRKAQNHPIGAFIWSFYENDAEEKQALLEKAAQVDFSYAYLNLAALKFGSQESPMEDLIKASQLHNHLAKHVLANLWVLQPQANLQKQARQMFADMAEKGDVDAQWKYGYLMAYGIGGEQQGLQARQWMQKAATSSSIAQFVLGYLNHMGQFTGVPDEKQAKYWFAKAENELPKASVALGYIYEVVDKNYALALKAYEKVREQEKVLANYNMALMYEYGKGLEPSFFKAKRYFISAADGGSASAMFRLASYYQDLGYHLTAHLYMEKAAALGYPRAVAALDQEYEL
jgi:enhanced entry protein EnhC